MPLLRLLGQLNPYHRQIAALAVTALFTWLSFTSSNWQRGVIQAWDLYASVLLILVWSAFFTSDPKHVHHTAKLQDSSHTAIFAFVLGAAAVSLLAILFLLVKNPQPESHLQRSYIVGAVFAVTLSWLLIHTLFTVHYAHVFYRDKKEKGVEGHGGGLSFPGKEQLDYLDFAYFAFVIGMTCQVSDVQITSGAMRRLALLHGLLSFAFNTAILALSLNVLSGLLR